MSAKPVPSGAWNSSTASANSMRTSAWVGRRLLASPFFLGAAFGAGACSTMWTSSSRWPYFSALARFPVDRQRPFPVLGVGMLFSVTLHEIVEIVPDTTWNHLHHLAARRSPAPNSFVGGAVA